MCLGHTRLLPTELHLLLFPGHMLHGLNLAEHRFCTALSWKCSSVISLPQYVAEEAIDDLVHSMLLNKREQTFGR